MESYQVFTRGSNHEELLSNVDVQRHDGDGNPFGLLYSQVFNLQPWQEINVPLLSQTVPAFAPAGEYSQISNIGIYPVASLTDQFQFTKAGGVATGLGNLSGWVVFDLQATMGFLSEIPSRAEIPSELSVRNAYPNPFNSSTTITLSLLYAAHISITLYDVLGREVASIANGNFQSGITAMSCDASLLSSGV